MVWIKFTLLSAGALCVLVACSKDTVGERGYRGALPPGCTGTTSAALGTDDAGDGDAAGASGGGAAGASADAGSDAAAPDASSATGGCGGGTGGAAGADAAAPTVSFGVSGCVVTQSCDLDFGYQCNGYNAKFSPTDVQQSCNGGGYAELPCTTVDGVGACAAENGNQCTVSVFYGPLYDSTSAANQCQSLGGRFAPTTGCGKVTQSCDGRSINGACADYDKGYDAAAVKAGCGSGKYATSECDRKKAVGGCMSLASDRCAVVWYYPPEDDKSVAQRCQTEGALFVAP